MEIFKSFRPEDGWICVSLSNVRAIVRHPIQGDHICWFVEQPKDSLIEFIKEIATVCDAACVPEMMQHYRDEAIKLLDEHGIRP